MRSNFPSSVGTLVQSIGRIEKITGFDPQATLIQVLWIGSERRHAAPLRLVAAQQSFERSPE
ncbi:MAG: hypothetical protein COB20_04200 [SAR86 cluster bacterium]|uniref:Uncharacterized protein n=1 Tax=SAR86 cluster bacterium TaxID=2030880 RepID=A0A2A4XAW8_9GAMM|nr:MAG: hypothetical protein COB20_04200 [SAR86 cluster bacterium]